jgi:hypothetical protein
MSESAGAVNPTFAVSAEVFGGTVFVFRFLTTQPEIEIKSSSAQVPKRVARLTIASYPQTVSIAAIDFLHDPFVSK